VAEPNDSHERIRPMLAAAAEAPLKDERFVYEPKYDGIRAIVDVRTDGEVHIWSRLGNENPMQFPDIVHALHKLGRKLKASVLLDGEIVALDEAGEPTGFQQLQGRIHLTGREDDEVWLNTRPAGLVAFDILRDGTARAGVRKRRSGCAAPQSVRSGGWDGIPRRGHAAWMGRIDREAAGLTLPLRTPQRGLEKDQARAAPGLCGRRMDGPRRRASEFAGVSTPVAWSEIQAGIAPDELTIATVPSRVQARGDLWHGLRSSPPVNLAAVLDALHL